MGPSMLQETSVARKPWSLIQLRVGSGLLTPEPAGTRYAQRSSGGIPLEPGDVLARARLLWARGIGPLLEWRGQRIDRGLDRVMLDEGLASTLRTKIAEISSIIAEQQTHLGTLHECRIASSERVRSGSESEPGKQ